MAIRVRSFRITNEAEENAINQFLENKIVRHWGTEFSGDPINGVWNVLVAYEERRDDPQERRNPRSREEHGRNDRNERPSDRDGRGIKNERGPKRDAPREKAPRPEIVIDVAQEDMPLYEAIRKWRNGIAKEQDLKPFSLFNNRQLQSIVKEKPHSSEALRQLLPEIVPELFDKYHNELLGFISGAVSDHSSSASTRASEPAMADSAL